MDIQEIKEEYERLIEEMKFLQIQYEDAYESYHSARANLEEFKAKYRKELDGI
jgi:capsule polysaccharide export protein KpsE/RkpR